MSHTVSALRSLLRQSVLALLCLSVPAQASSNVLKLIIPAVLVGKGWQLPQSINHSNTASEFHPQIAFDSSGNAIAVWMHVYMDSYREDSIMVSRYAPGSSWSTPQIIAADQTQNLGNPQVAISADGVAVVVWRRSDSSVLASRQVPGGSWEVPQVMNTGITGIPDIYPHVAADSTGNAIVIWAQTDGNIWARRYAAGVGWEAAQQLVASSGSNPQIAMHGSGKAIAVWQQMESSTASSCWARYYNGSDWDPAPQQLKQATGHVNGPQVAFDGAGNAMAVWSQDAGADSSFIWSNRYMPGSGWGVAVRVSVLSPMLDTSRVYYPQVAVSNNGKATAVWEQSDGFLTNIYSSSYVPGSGWSAMQIISNKAGTTSHAQIAMDAAGNAVAVWEQEVKGSLPETCHWNIWANRYSTGSSKWGMAKLIEFNETGDAFVPQVAADAAGNAIAVWSQSEGNDRWDVKAALLK